MLAYSAQHHVNFWHDVLQLHRRAAPAGLGPRIAGWCATSRLASDAAAIRCQARHSTEHLDAALSSGSAAARCEPSSVAMRVRFNVSRSVRQVCL